MTCSAARIFAELSDGWGYTGWVVGAARMRDVGTSWPQVGACLHHSVGAWPALIDDRTEVLEVQPGVRLVLLARGWPMGEAHVELCLADLAPTIQSRERCRVTMRERPVRGIGVLAGLPVISALVVARNRESLRRLEYRALRR